MQGCLTYTDEWSPEAVILGHAFSNQNAASSFALSYSAQWHELLYVQTDYMSRSSSYRKEHN